MPDFFDNLSPHDAARLMDAIFEAKGADFALVDGDLRYLHVSASHAEKAGRPASHHVGVPVAEWMEPERWQQTRPHLEAALQGHTTRNQPHTGREPSPTPLCRASFIPVRLSDCAPMVALLIEKESDLAKKEAELRDAKQNEADALALVEQNDTRRYEFMRDVLLSVTEGRLHLCREINDLPPRREPFGSQAPLPLTTRGGVRELRQWAGKAARAVGITEADWFDMETAVGEAGMNTVVHADGGVGSVATGDHNALQVWITDGGGGIPTHHLPRAVLQKGFTTAGTMGYGFSMMIQSCDKLWLLTGTGGTTIVLEKYAQAA